MSILTTDKAVKELARDLNAVEVKEKDYFELRSKCNLAPIAYSRGLYGVTRELFYNRDDNKFYVA